MAMTRGGGVDGDAPHVTTIEFDLAGMHTSADVDADGRKVGLQPQSGAERPAGSVEHGEDPVTRCLHHGPAARLVTAWRQTSS